MREPRKLLAAAAVGVNIVAAGATVWMLLRQGGGAVDPGTAAWAVAPSLLFLLISVVAARSVWDASVALFGSVFVCGWGASLIYDAFFVHPDPQSGLVVVVLPALQLWGAAATVFAMILLNFVKWLLWPKRPAVAGTPASVA